MKKLVRHFVIVLTTMMVVSGFGVWFILKKFFPELLIDTYFLVPVFFYVIGLVFIVVLRLMPKNQPRQMVNLYMLLRLIKVFVAIAVILIYWFFDKENIRNFATILIIFYLIYLVIETYIYSRMEMFLKKKHEENNPPKKKLLKN